MAQLRLPAAAASLANDSIGRLAWHAAYTSDRVRYARIFQKYRNHTMIPKRIYAENLALAKHVADVSGCVVECGTWRGGMIAGIADVLGPDRAYYLYDSFEGLPPATAADGDKAIRYQAEPTDPLYYDNCTASEGEARAAMAMSAATRVKFVKGWFENTLASTPPDEPIALLRLDGDWYESTKCILENFAPRVVPGGIIVIDDYYYWQGCTRAVNEYASKHDWQMRQSRHGVCFVTM